MCGLVAYLYNRVQQVEMLGEKQVESAVIQVNGWMIVSTYVGKAKPLSHDRSEEKIKLIVSSLDKVRENDYMYVFEILNLKELGLVDAKEFKDLKEFHYYLKFNPENFRFKLRRGEGIVSTLYQTKNEKRNVIVEIKGGNRFILEDQPSKQNRIQKQLDEISKQNEDKANLDRDYQEFQAYGDDTLVVETLKAFLEQKNPKKKKILIQSALMDLESPECEMKNDREVDREAIGQILDALPKLNQLQSLTIQWHKLSTTKAIADIFKKCAGHKNLKVINFDNLGNGFLKESLAEFNKNKIEGIQELNIFFNIWDEDNYFEQSWWHPEHSEKYKGKAPIQAEEWLHFAASNQALTSIWIPKNGPKDIELLKLKDWTKITLGYYEDQEMKDDYWKNVIHRFSAKSQLVSLCLSRIKDLNDEALYSIFKSSQQTLEYLMLNWCQKGQKGQKGTSKGLELIGQCKMLKYINFKHSPLQENKDINFSFLKGLDRLEYLNIDNFKGAKGEVEKYIYSEVSKGLKLFGAPRNDWVTIDLLNSLSKKKKLTKLNLYNVHGFKVEEAVKVLGEFQLLKVLNLGATEFNLVHILEIVKGLKYLKKLNISDIKSEKSMNSKYYEENWQKVKYPPLDKEAKKPYKDMSNNEKEEFAFLINNREIAEILPHLPRLTHFDIRNLGIDERPFANPKLVPLLRYVGCEFELYKKMQTLGRRGLNFV